MERSWDVQAGEVKPKSYNGARLVPIAAVLRDYLVEHRANARDPEGYVFVTATGAPFGPATVARRADKAWQETGEERISCMSAATASPRS